MTQQEKDALRDYILQAFNSGMELNLWLCTDVWPRMKQRSGKIDDVWADLDGSPLSEREAMRRYKQRLPMRHKASGIIKQHNGRIWVPVTET